MLAIRQKSNFLNFPWKQPSEPEGLKVGSSEVGTSFPPPFWEWVSLCSSFVSIETVVVTNRSSKFQDIQSNYSENNNSWPCGPRTLPRISLIYSFAFLGFCSSGPLPRELPWHSNKGHRAVNCPSFFTAHITTAYFIFIWLSSVPLRNVSYMRARIQRVWLTPTYPLEKKTVTQEALLFKPHKDSVRKRRLKIVESPVLPV